MIPTQLEFVDIAGLVRGASKGEGLGNQFLRNIRECDAIAHVLRCFEDDDITHVNGSIDPLRDAETVETELMLADLENLERRFDQIAKRAKNNDREAKKQAAVMESLIAALREGKPARSIEFTKEQLVTLKQLQLLTDKPIMYVCNVDEGSAATGNSLSKKMNTWAHDQGAFAVTIAAAIEAEVASLATVEEQAEFLESLGLGEAGLARMIRAGYKLLNLLTFFTAGPKESRAWTVCDGTTAPEAAGTIHTDFQRGFIAAETIDYNDYINCNGEKGSKEAGKMRQEGREYKVKDGDIFLFRFNV